MDPDEIARQLAAQGKPVSRKALRKAGMTGSNEALTALAERFRARHEDQRLSAA